MAELISFSEDECGSGSGDSDSGVAESYIAKCRDLSFDLATFDVDGNLTDIPWATVSSPYVHVVPTNDDSAYYNQKYDDVNDLVVQEGYFRISGINATNVAAADLYKDGCCFVAIHVLQNGKAIIQGVEKVFYEGEFHLVPSGGKTTAKSVNVNTNSGSLPARLDFVLSSYSEHFSLFIEDINPFLDIEPPEEPPGTPTISNNITGAVISAPTASTADCGHGTVKTAVYLNNNPAGHISLGSYPFDAAAHFCGQDSDGATSIKVSSTVTTVCGTVADVDTIPITVTGGIISAVNGVSCGLDFSPTVDLTIVGNIVTGMVVNSKGLPIASQYIAIIVNGSLAGTLPLSFPINLNTYLCGDGPYTDPITLKIRATVAVTGQTTANDEITVPATLDGYGYINSVAGVACPAPTILPPSVSVSTDGISVTAVWDDGGDLGAVRTLSISNGTTTISLDPDDTDLGTQLYGQEVDALAVQNWTLTAMIENTIDTATDTAIVSIHTETWASGRFIYAVNSVEAPPPVINSVTYDGNNVVISKTDGIWKYYQVEVRYHRNPTGWAEGVYALSDGNAVDDGVFIFGIGNLTSKFCGNQHVIGSPFVAARVYTGLTGYHAKVDGAALPFTVGGTNLITSINGVAC